jgi:glutamate dehydrogenase/leucine dehydrogenase
MPPVRRLAAILAADVAGYSRLMGQDEAGTARVLREHRAAADPLVTEHHGRIVKTTGDGVLIQFASVVEAVECALALQRLAAERNADLPRERRMESEEALAARGVLVLPDFIVNAGGVICAAVEYRGGTEVAALALIDEKIRANIEAMLEEVRRTGALPRIAALSLATERVRRAMRTRRWDGGVA